LYKNTPNKKNKYQKYKIGVFKPYIKNYKETNHIKPKKVIINKNVANEYMANLWWLLCYMVIIHNP